MYDMYTMILLKTVHALPLPRLSPCLALHRLPPQISSAEELQSLLERGALCRTTASTNMNAHSSRSHAICTLSFEMVRAATEQTEETVTSSQFHLVDLAGSERAKKTGAEVRRRRKGGGGGGRGGREREGSWYTRYSLCHAWLRCK